jgi:hypothetical protein
MAFRWINCRPIPCEVNYRAIQGVTADSKDGAIIYTYMLSARGYLTYAEANCLSQPVAPFITNRFLPNHNISRSLRLCLSLNNCLPSGK